MEHFAFNTKGQLSSKANYQAVNSSKKQPNEFIFTSMRCVFIRFLEESLARKNVSRLSDLYQNHILKEKSNYNSMGYFSIIKGPVKLNVLPII